jgi:zinc protease
MKKFTTLLLAILITGLTGYAQMANPQEPLQNDPAVRMGKLDNGLTYYIRHNAKPENRAEFYLFTNVGAIQENEHQDGLAHFLEHMALNGTKNLPGKMMINYLESIGCSFGANINASTGVEQTMYMLNNVPLLREGVLDTCLLILHDYSHFVSNLPEEIDLERGVIIEELRTRRDAQWRMFEATLPYLYKGSKYAECNLIGTIEGISTFDYQHLIDFYETWYRPDHQAVIIVGDIDVDQVYNKLEVLFQDVPKPDTPSPKKLIPIPENDDPIVGIITDPEAQSTSVTLIVKSDPVPHEMQPLGMIYMVDMFKSFITRMMNDRLQEIAQQPNAPFLGASMGFSPLTTSADVTLFAVAAKDGESDRSFHALLVEVEKMRRYGFTDAELERAKTNYLRRLERAVENAGDRMNAEFIQSIINHFAYNKPILDPAYELQVAQGYMPFIQLDQLNQIAAQLITEENRIVLVNSPEREGLVLPTEKELIDLMDSVEEMELEAYEEEDLDMPLVDISAIVPGTIVKEEKGAFETTVWHLSNGIRVVVKPTDYKKDEVLFSLRNDGGQSTLPEELLPSTEGNIFSLWSQSSGVGPFKATELKRKLTGKIASVGSNIQNYNYGINGTGSPQDLETLLELVYAQIVTPRFEESEFEAPMAQLRALVPNLEQTPNYKLQRELIKTLFDNNPRSLLVSSDLLEKVSVKNLEKAYRHLFSNMNGSLITIVGNVDLETLKPLVELYLASLPSAPEAHTWKNDGNRIQKGLVENHFNIEMETPKTSIVNVYSADIENTLENTVYIEAVQSVLNMAYIQSLREDEGGTYGASVQQMMTDRPQEYAALIIALDTDPEKYERMRHVMDEDIKNILEQGPSEEYVSKTRENFLKKREEELIKNSFWRQVVVTYYQEGRDIFTDYETIVKGITTSNLRDFFQKFLDQGNFIDISMSPAL